LLSTFAFKFHLRRYIKVIGVQDVMAAMNQLNAKNDAVVRYVIDCGTITPK